jgi:hypothetical protein
MEQTNAFGNRILPAVGSEPRIYNFLPKPTDPCMPYEDEAPPAAAYANLAATSQPSRHPLSIKV